MQHQQTINTVTHQVSHAAPASNLHCVTHKGALLALTHRRGGAGCTTWKRAGVALVLSSDTVVRPVAPGCSPVKARLPGWMASCWPGVHKGCKGVKGGGHRCRLWRRWSQVHVGAGAVWERRRFEGTGWQDVAGCIRGCKEVHNKGSLADPKSWGHSTHLPKVAVSHRAAACR
jgi:hypothetical protein